MSGRRMVGAPNPGWQASNLSFPKIHTFKYKSSGRLIGQAHWIPSEMCTFWRMIFRVIGGVCNFLKAATRQNREMLMISNGKQHLLNQISW